MSLVAVTPATVDAFVAFLKEHGDPEGREYLERVDVRPAILRRAGCFFWPAADRPAATLSVDRTSRPDGSLMISVSIEPKGRRAATLLACLAEFLAGEPPTAGTLRRYRLHEPPGLAMPEAALVAAGFERVAGRVKYLRDPGPPREGEFPGAGKALAAGYAVTEATAEVIAARSDLFDRLADLYNRAFAGHANVAPRDPAVMRERLTAAGGGFLIAIKDDELTGYLGFTPMESEILVGEYASLRRHWGTGSVDLLCRTIAALVAERWGWPIIGYADASNAPSCRAMERAGMTRVADYPLWERRVEAGTPLEILAAVPVPAAP